MLHYDVKSLAKSPLYFDPKIIHVDLLDTETGFILDMSCSSLKSGPGFNRLMSDFIGGVLHAFLFV